ncbi:MAG: [Fe-S]-binding protein [Pirellulales bacterium]|nr:[Fe-S]-binding protein [Pirellulales bacterium]
MAPDIVADAFPRLFRLQQIFPRPRLDDVVREVGLELAKLDLANRIRPHQRIAITAGSRGIAGIPAILAATGTYFRSLGAVPFLIPAMGSHGGATESGQRAVLASLGLTSDTCGCPIESSMETDILFESPLGFPIHCDRLAHHADGLFIVGRIKPHTLITGPIQSGLCKMLLVGLGKQKGASTIHAALSEHGFFEILESSVPRMVRELNVLGGLAIVENAYSETATVEAIQPGEFLTQEPRLLEQATEWMPRLPFDDVDILVIDAIGKDISGSGLDTNIVGRKFNDNRAVPGEKPIVRRIVARSLTPASEGNGLGVGIADIITQKLYAAINQEVMWTNGITSGHLGAVKIAPIYASDRAAITAALESLPCIHPRTTRLLWIQDTRNLLEVDCSEAYLPSAQSRSNLAIQGPLMRMEFDQNGQAIRIIKGLFP